MSLSHSLLRKMKEENCFNSFSSRNTESMVFLNCDLLQEIDFVWVVLQLARTDVARSSCFEWGELLCLASFEV